ncbi:MAG: CHAT domain-containing protein [Candidatus Eisenbacteria bacterium]|nr:CHAT domain-containing protein [Candidatus Latescibacterota bacterium]MBD3302337.1 CHAT domain-containing protein [Candidatus Eisenbacteria bacterium]
MSKPRALELEDLIELSPAEVRRIVEEGRVKPAPSLVEAIRGEAGRFYHVDAVRARRIAQIALALGELSGDPVSLGWGHRAMGEALWLGGRPREAEPHYEAASAVWRGAGENGALGQLLVGRTHLLALLGRYTESEAAAEEARRLLEAAGDDPYLAKLAMNLGNVHFQRESYHSALREYERAAALFARQGTRDPLVVGLEINRGVALSQLERDREALDLFDRLLEECEDDGHALLSAQVRMNAAYVHSQRADYAVALQELGRAEAYFRRTEHPSFLAACLLNRSEIYHQLNLDGDALRLAGEAEPLFAKEGMVYDRALAASQVGLSRMALRRPRSALSAIRRAQRLFEQESNAVRIAWAEMIEVESLAERGRSFDEAIPKARSALETFAGLRLVRWEAAAALLLGRLAPEPPRERIDSLRRMLRRVPRRIYPMTAYRLLEAIGQEEEKRDRPGRAASTYRRAVDLLEDVRVRIPTEDSKIAFLQGKTHLYDRLLDLETRRTRPSFDRLLEWIERSKAQSFRDRWRLPAELLGTEEAGERVTELRRRLAWLHGRLSRLELGTSAERRHLPELRRELRKVEEEWSRALREREERSAGPGGGTGPIPDAGALKSAIIERLPEGGGFLDYYVGPGFCLALGITRSGSFVRTLPSDTGRRVERLARRLDLQWDAAALAGSTGGISATAERMAGLAAGTDRILAQLYDLLWRPIEEAAGSRVDRWILSPHGPIHRIPMHALRNGDGYLIERSEVATIPSGQVLSMLPPRRRRGGGTAWAGGVASPRLPGVARELDLVAQRLSTHRVETDPAATRERVTAAAAGARILHLAAHGALRSDNPAFSYLELADGPFFVQDIGSMRLPGSLVVLSACSSGRGETPVGDEWIGLARGFLRAGATSVIASLWPIHEGPTLDLVDRFYGGLAAGEETPAALRGAMCEARRTWRHPWAWAPFALLGGV